MLKKIHHKFKVAVFLWRNAGPQGLARESKIVVKKYLGRYKPKVQPVKDVLFISIDEPLLDRYRTRHMMESLESAGVTCDRIVYYKLTPDMEKYYNAFIFYRSHYEPHMKEFFKRARKNNKPTFYAVDDLVFNTEYTKDLEIIKAMSKEDRKLYDDGVVRHGKLASMCDYGIATTEVIAREFEKMKNFKKVIVDRNKMSLEMVHYSDRAIEEVAEDDDRIVVGYFSGTDTHNEDFAMVAPALKRLMDEDDKVFIKLAGKIRAPEEFIGYEDRLIFTPYVDYKKLPFELRKADIILAPLQDYFFNTAKSEIKWLEAALVQRPVVASNVGSYAQNIDNGKTGILVDNTTDEWYKAIKRLTQDKSLRNKIAANAYDYTLTNTTTVGKNAQILKKQILDLTPNIYAFTGISLSAISGGNIVIQKHMEILREAGNIVCGIELHNYTNEDPLTKLNSKLDEEFNILRINSQIQHDFIHMDMKIDNIVATFWATARFVNEFPRAAKKTYFIQSYEPDFYNKNQSEYLKALKSYSFNFSYLTMSRWCQKWLSNEFGQSAKYISDGIDIKNFKLKPRKNFKDRKIRILIEGDSGSYYKKVDESFKISNQLDRDKFEITYLSYNGLAKDWYITDKVYNRVDPKKVGQIYAENDILLKSSELESFSLPPLEMMATGGVSVVKRNFGNAEYAKDGDNIIYYNSEEDAIAKINDLGHDFVKYQILAKNGRATAERFDWRNIREDLIEVYE